MADFLMDPLVSLPPEARKSIAEADEEILAVLEEVVMYTFQQTVYYLTKTLYVTLPVILESNPFALGTDDLDPATVGVKQVLSVLQSAHNLLRDFHLHRSVTSQLFCYLFFFVSTSLFNSLIGKGASQRDFRWSRGVQLRGNLDLVEGWASDAGLGEEATTYLSKISAMADLLATPKLQLLQADWLGLRRDFPSLSPVQLHHVLQNYNLSPGKSRPHGWEPQGENMDESGELLESFNNHPPLLLPDDGYQVSLTQEVQDKTFYDILHDINAKYGIAEDDVDSGLSLTQNRTSLITSGNPNIYFRGEASPSPGDDVIPDSDVITDVIALAPLRGRKGKGGKLGDPYPSPRPKPPKRSKSTKRSSKSSQNGDDKTDAEESAKQEANHRPDTTITASRSRDEKRPVRPQRKKRDARRRSQLELEGLSGVSDCESVRSEAASVKSVKVREEKHEAKHQDVDNKDVHVQKSSVNLHESVPIDIETVKLKTTAIDVYERKQRYESQPIQAEERMTSHTNNSEVIHDVSYLTSEPIYIDEPENILEMSVDTGNEVTLRNRKENSDAQNHERYDPHGTEKRREARMGKSLSLHDENSLFGNTDQSDVISEHDVTMNDVMKKEKRRTVHGDFPGDFLSRYLSGDAESHKVAKNHKVIVSPRDRKQKFDVRSHLRRQSSRESLKPRIDQVVDINDQDKTEEKNKEQSEIENGRNNANPKELNNNIKRGGRGESQGEKQNRDSLRDIKMAEEEQVSVSGPDLINRKETNDTASNGGTSSGWSNDIQFIRPVIKQRRDYNKDTDASEARSKPDLSASVSVPSRSSDAQVTDKRLSKSLEFPWTSSNKEEPCKEQGLEILIIDPPSSGKGEENGRTVVRNAENTRRNILPMDTRGPIKFKQPHLHINQSEELEVPNEGEPETEHVYANLPESPRRPTVIDKRWQSGILYPNNTKIPPQPRKPAPVLQKAQNMDDNPLEGIDEEAQNVYSYKEEQAAKNVYNYNKEGQKSQGDTIEIPKQGGGGRRLSPCSRHTEIVKSLQSHRKLEELFGTLSPDLIVLDLNKGKGGLGLGLIDGMYTSLNQEGIYVRTLVQGGPADLDGTLTPGDRILWVNGSSLLGASYTEAMELIRTSGPQLKMMVSRGTLKDKELILASPCDL